MSNEIKYSLSSDSNSLRIGNFNLSVGIVPRGPTSETGYWNGLDVTPNGYTIYIDKGSNGPSIYRAETEQDVITIVRNFSGNSYTTISECLSWSKTRDDFFIVNKQYPAIVTDGLVLLLDAGFVPSYPTTGNTWYDLSSSYKLTK
jgi:hypothetical protein